MSKQGTAYTDQNKPKHADRVLWNWRGGTNAIVQGRKGQKVEILFEGDKGRWNRAEVFPSSLRLIERPSAKKDEAVA